MSKPAKLILIRHAPVEKMAGFLPMNDGNAIITEVQIRKLANRLPKNCIWYVSPLKRTIQTTEALSEYVTIKEMIIENNLREQNFGDWEGRKISEVWKEIQNNKNEHNHSFISPEVCPPNGDCFLDQCMRVSIWLRELDLMASKTYIVIAHAGTIKAALSYMLEIDPDKAIGIEVSHLALNIVEVLRKEHDRYRGGRYRLLCLNQK